MFRPMKTSKSFMVLGVLGLFSASNGASSQERVQISAAQGAPFCLELATTIVKDPVVIGSQGFILAENKFRIKSKFPTIFYHLDLQKKVLINRYPLDGIPLALKRAGSLIYIATVDQDKNRSALHVFNAKTRALDEVWSDDGSVEAVEMLGNRVMMITAPTETKDGNLLICKLQSDQKCLITRLYKEGSRSRMAASFKLTFGEFFKVGNDLYIPREAINNNGTLGVELLQLVYDPQVDNVGLRTWDSATFLNGRKWQLSPFAIYKNKFFAIDFTSSALLSRDLTQKVIKNSLFQMNQEFPADPMISLDPETGSLLLSSSTLQNTNSITRISLLDLKKRPRGDQLDPIWQRELSGSISASSFFRDQIVLAQENRLVSLHRDQGTIAQSLATPGNYRLIANPVPSAQSIYVSMTEASSGNSLFCSMPVPFAHAFPEPTPIALPAR